MIHSFVLFYTSVNSRHTRRLSQFDPVGRNLLHSGEKLGKVSRTSPTSEATSCRCGWIFSLALAAVCSGSEEGFNRLFDEPGLHEVGAWSSEIRLILLLSLSKLSTEIHVDLVREEQNREQAELLQYFSVGFTFKQQIQTGQSQNLKTQQ